MKARSTANAIPLDTPGEKCARGIMCRTLAPRDPKRTDDLCEACGLLADWRETGNHDLLPNRGLCTIEMKGVRCGVAWHDKECSLYKPASAPPAKPRSAFEIAMGADPDA